MSLSRKQKIHIQNLAEGRVAPVNGLEIHFCKVIAGKGSACSVEEKGWLAYWHSIKNPEPDIPVVESSSGAATAKFDIKEIKGGLTARIKSGITEIERRTDITDDQKVSKITQYACVACASIAVQPIPFADIFVLTPIQAYFGTRIAAIRGLSIKESEVTDLIKELVGVIGLGFIAQQIAIGIWKTVSFGAGGLLTVPLVYALSYAVMKVIDAYYSAKAKKSSLTDAQIKDLWKRAFREGKEKNKKSKEYAGDG